MIELYNAISNIAEHIEDEVFENYENYAGYKDDKTTHLEVYKACTEIIKKELSKTKSAREIISKNLDEPHVLHDKGKYIVTYVSIDNIDLLDVNFSLGSIFGIYENTLDPKSIKAAIYVTYGPTFQLVYASLVERVKYFSYEDGEFIQQESFELAQKGKINSTAGCPGEWSKEHKQLVDGFFADGYRLRFSDALSLDTHQILFKRGGIYSSPSTEKNPNGLLEMFFEAVPISFIIELAGGQSIDNNGVRILEKECSDLHQKTPIYFGSNDEIQKVKEHLGV